MPRKAINYSNSCVYKICCNDINIKHCYVGSSTNFNKRRNQHKNDSNNENIKSYNLNVYKFIRDNGGWDNWGVVLVELYPDCKSREELVKFERYHMEQLEAKLNSQVPGRTRKEYRTNNSEKRKEYDKKYKRNNAEKIKEQKKEKVECEFCHSVVRKDNLSRHCKSKKCLATQ